MKRTMCSTILILAIASCSSCVRSIQPFYEQKDVYFDSSLIGTWIDPGGAESWKIRRLGEKEYVIDQTDEEGQTTRFEARLFRLGRRSFIDLVATSSGDTGNGQKLAPHTFVAVKKDRCTARMSYLDPAWLKTLLANNPKAIRHANLDGEIVLTDSTRNLQTFIRKHLASPGAFEQTETLYKKGETQCERKD